MTVPSKQAFQESLEFLSRPLAVDLLQDFDPCELRRREITPSTQRLIDKAWRHWEQSLVDANDLTAVRWAKTDRFASAAKEAFTKRYPPFLLGQSSVDHHPFRARHIEYEGLFPGYSVIVMLDDFQHPEARWLLSLLAPLKQYFYEPDAIERGIAARKKIDKLEKMALAGLEARKEVGLHFGTFLGTSWMTPSLVESRYTTELWKLQKDFGEARSLASPIVRNDRTARERLLAFQFWRYQRTSFKHIYPTVIKKLMLMEGVKHQIDDSTMDGMLRTYAERYQRTTMGGVRNLLADIRGYKFRAFARESYQNFSKGFVGPQQPNNNSGTAP